MFNDHFSGHAQQYAAARPTYPKSLFDYIATISPAHDVVWDCATGNGQAAYDLADHFKHVIATDASAEQIQNAKHKPNIDYRVALAEKSGLADNSVDAVVVAQALHWFDFDKFFAEVKRVLKPNGVFITIAYELLSTNNDKINEVVNEFYYDITAPYWPPERDHINKKYQSIPFPFMPIDSPTLEIELHWQVQQLSHYLSTWSAVKRYNKENNIDVIEYWIEPRFNKIMAAADDLVITIPLILKAGTVD